MKLLVLFARVVICILLFCVPFILLIEATGRPDNRLWLIIPVFGAIPAVLGALFIFVPLESYLDRRGLGHFKNKAVPLAGALLIVIFMAIMWGVQGKLIELIWRIWSGGIHMIWPILLWSLFGAIWGV